MNSRLLCGTPSDSLSSRGSRPGGQGRKPSRAPAHSRGVGTRSKLAPGDEKINPNEEPANAVSRLSAGRLHLEALAFSLGMCCFAASRGRWTAVSAAGLFVAAVAVVHFIFTAPSPGAVVGFRRGRLVLPTSLLAVLLGLVLAVLYRNWLGQSLFPPRLGRFAVVAVGIGALEEFFYRGYLQGRLSGLGHALSVGLAAAAHAAYKTCLFAAPPHGHETNLVLLGVCTFAGGVVFGGMRALTRSIAPPLLAHACLDLLVYGGLESAPWWVWS